MPGMSDEFDEILPLFAFGTLRRGEANHHYLAGRYERVLAARLLDYAVVGPLMIDRSPGSVVPGELFFLRPGSYAATIADCDELEGITPRMSRYAAYERRRVKVLTDQGAIDAWAYVRPDSCLPVCERLVWHETPSRVEALKRCRSFWMRCDSESRSTIKPSQDDPARLASPARSRRRRCRP